LKTLGVVFAGIEVVVVPGGVAFDKYGRKKIEIKFKLERSFYFKFGYFMSA
jgi:hypothetical protein